MENNSCIRQRADIEQINAAYSVGAEVCEIHTGPYSNSFYLHGRDQYSKDVQSELKKIAIRHFIIYRNTSPNPNHTRLGDLPETFDAAISDSILVDPLSPEDLTESKELLRRTNSRRIRKHLQANPSIQTLAYIYKYYLVELDMVF